MIEPTVFEPISDEQWKLLIAPEKIYAAQKAAEIKYNGIDTETYNHLRRQLKQDFFVCAGAMGFDRFSPVLHGHLDAWMCRNADWRFKEILLPRGHIKSTGWTIVDGVQIVLPDDANVSAYPRNMGPDCRLLICHETDGQASNFLFVITSAFVSNPLIMGLFPECVPSPRKQRVNRHELELPRTTSWPEPTVDTMGVGGRSQGRHYNYLKLDDLIGDKARDSKVMMDGAKEWLDNIQSFFSDHKQDHFDLIGTRWAFDDIYSHMHERYGKKLLRYIRGVEEPVKNAQGQTVAVLPIFPEGFSTDDLDILRKNRRVWSAQYANNPEEGATEFDKSWKRFYRWVGMNQLNVVVGPATNRVNARDLDVCILYDPAMSGKAGIVVTGTRTIGGIFQIFILEALKEEWTPPQATDLMFKLVARWQPRCVAIEEVLFSGLFKHWWEAEMKLRNMYFGIIPVSPLVGGKNISKAARVRSLANYFSARQIYFSDAKQEELLKEYDSFGATEDYHMLDALAYGPEVWMPRETRAKADAFKKAEHDYLLPGRDVTTGYSSID